MQKRGTTMTTLALTDLRLAVAAVAVKEGRELA